MIPKFTTEGLLPSGTYLITSEDFEKRFVYGIKRIELYEGLKKLINDLKTIGCNNIYIDGSFVTNKRLPKDIDVCWDNSGIDLHEAKRKFPILFDLKYPRRDQQMTYKCDIFPAFVTETNSQKMFIHFFQYDKLTNQRKGIIQIKI